MVASMKRVRSMVAGKQAGADGAGNLGRSLIDIAMLYASKAGAVIVGVLILPQFNRLLGPEQFGVVAVIFSLQALLLILDFGMSTIVGRDIAADDSSRQASVDIWRSAETVLNVAYAALGVVLISVASLMRVSLTLPQMLLTAVLLWALTQQNVATSALLAKRRYLDTGIIQLAGVLVRGVGTLAAMKIIGVSLDVFLISQCVLALAQYLVSWVHCNKVLSIDGVVGRVTLEGCRRLFLRGKPLMLFGLAGAAVMQLDKPIVSTFMSPAELGPYYLAMVLCLTPISTLAGPVMQFFQPRLVNAIHERDDVRAGQVLQRYATIVVLATILPTGILWLFRGPLVQLWLLHGTGAPQVIEYAGILLPGIAIGALGYVPYVLLVAHQDFRFQAVASTVMTVITLGLALAAASRSSMIGVCWVYACYHSVSTLVSWTRCLVLARGDRTRYVERNAVWTALWVLVGGGAVIAVYALMHAV
ncbi:MULTISPECIES: lipopolysaccharide biosynthesis protein [unclassified Ralstonia]|uniref:lipopolysaccharide biosynthesis protein n=1 Tax=unclassified Ralstonia TaxID=209769 RepID=UPI002CB11388|nr:lipopolysaccharide biosynthesis protein [Ralstonia sp.]HWV05894.1 lipopolysaccharide biosynthesis protein [Ralstonia sp.]